MLVIIIMNQINDRAPDLNLLRVFLTIWNVRNMTLAGERLSLTQSAVSHSLSRLRVMFNDPLFVRSKGGMTPTQKANNLYQPLHEAFSTIQHTLQSQGTFDPATANRVFRLAMSDVSEFSYLPPLAAYLEQVAPSVRLEIVPLDVSTVGTAMRAGEVDFTVGFVPGLEDGFVSRRLFSDSFICLIRAGHAMAGASLTNDTLVQLRYIYASSNASGHRLIEQWLSDAGIKRHIVLRLANITIAPAVVRGSDLAVIFPKSVARNINRNGEFSLLPLPPGHPTVEIMAHSHARFSADQGLQWMLDTMVELFQFADGNFTDRRPRAAPANKRRRRV